MTLEARLKRIELMEGRLNPHRHHRFCRLVASDDEAEEARREATEQGYDPDRDLFLIRLVPIYPSRATECGT